MNKGLLLAFLLMSLNAYADLVGKPAPKIELKNQNGETVTLDKFKDKLVVLEWLNYGCPFVKKHYNSGNMPSLQKKYTDKGVVWLSVISSAEGEQGYSSPEKAQKDKEMHKSAATMVLLDPSGVVGKAYDAKTTPHMYIINKEGKVAYEGAIDSIASTDIEDISKSENYVSAALDALLDGKAVKTQKTKPYGCSVKYK